MAKRILVTEKQMARIINMITEDDTAMAAAQAQYKDSITDISTYDKKLGEVEPNSMKAYLDAYERFLKDKGLCTANMNEEVISEGIVDDLKSTFKKAVIIASAGIALGILTPQEAQAQVGSSGDPEIIKLFKGKGRDACNPNRGQAKLASSKQKPTSGVLIYKAEPIAPKFRLGSKGSDKYFVKDKDGDYKEVSQKQLERIKKKHNISTRIIKGDELKKAIQQNK